MHRRGGGLLDFDGSGDGLLHILLYHAILDADKARTEFYASGRDAALKCSPVNHTVVSRTVLGKVALYTTL